MRHTEVAETPCECGCDGQCSVRSDRTVGDHVALEDIEVTFEALNVCKYIVEAVYDSFSKSENNNKSYRHDDTLYEVCGGSSKEAA